MGHLTFRALPSLSPPPHPTQLTLLLSILIILSFQYFRAEGELKAILGHQ